MTLLANPLRGIGVPLVVRTAQLAKGGFNVIPTLLILQPPTNQLGDVGAAPSGAGPPVQIRDKFIAQGYVQSHVLRLAHSRSEVLAGGDTFDGAAAGRFVGVFADERTNEHDSLALLAGDLRPVVGIGGVGQVFVFLVFLFD